MNSAIKSLISVIKRFSQEASGILFWTGYFIGLVMGLSVSATVLMYFNLRML